MVAVMLALACPATAGAGYWQWGHNVMSPTVNPSVSSGYNYWADQYLHKHSGGYITHGFSSAGGTCWDFMQGDWTEHYHTPSELGCGGYLYNFVNYYVGGQSYLLVDSST